MTDDDYRLDDAEARTLRATLVAELAAAGAFPDPRWRQVFKTVPRHVFVPHVFVPADTAGTYRPLDGTDPARRGEWLRHVYADDIAITQLDGDEKAWKAAMRDGTVTAEAMTCTSSQPALMAGMLAELGVADGARVLEVGTGTGYNAALLAERLGSDLVTTVDVDPGLAEGSRAALAGLGYTPHVVAGDGAAGVEGRAPFDRIVATASFPTIPAAWVEQSAENGVILANLARPLGGVAALVRLVVHGAVAEGRFCARPAGYMPTRTDRTPRRSRSTSG
ncbi:methyltransferase domain-containing protein [Nocardiopsis composta]